MAGGCVVLVREAEKRAKNCAGCSKPATLPGWVEGVEVDPGQSEPAIAPFSVPARPACAGIDGISVEHGPPGHASTTTTSHLLIEELSRAPGRRLLMVEGKNSWPSS